MLGGRLKLTQPTIAEPLRLRCNMVLLPRSVSRVPLAEPQTGTRETSGGLLDREMD